MELMRLVVQQHLHPERDLHASWLPADWPARYRRVSLLGPGGQAAVAELLRRTDPSTAAWDFNVDARVRRLALLDGASLRRLAAYCGFAAHKPLLRMRGIGSQLKRQARRYDSDGARFIEDRLPALTALRMNPQRLQQRPIATGRIVVERGYRLLFAALAGEDSALVQRVQRKLPRRVATLPVPALEPQQVRQLHELMLLAIVPERLPQWDWLF